MKCLLILKGSVRMSQFKSEEIYDRTEHQNVLTLIKHE
jgi:hypothetical protein